MSSFSWEDITLGNAGAAQGAPTGGIYQPNIGAFNVPDYPSNMVTMGAGGKMNVSPQSQYNSQMNILLVGGAVALVVWLLVK